MLSISLPYLRSARLILVIQFRMSCPRCQEGYILPGEPTGTIEKAFNGAYYSPAPDGKEASHAVILLTDAFGLATKNCKVMADEFAKRLNCDVWIPDYFEGESDSFSIMPAVRLDKRLLWC